MGIKNEFILLILRDPPNKVSSPVCGPTPVLDMGQWAQQAFLRTTKEAWFE